jgi:hypothetical protein
VIGVEGGTVGAGNGSENSSPPTGINSEVDSIAVMVSELKSIWPRFARHKTLDMLLESAR